MKVVVWEERYVALNIYSKLSAILLAGFLSGVCLAAMFALSFFPVMSVESSLRGLYPVSAIAVLVGLSVAGIVAAYVVYKYVKTAWEDFGIYDYQEPVSFFVFLLGIALSGYCVLANMSRSGLMVQNYVWLFPLVVGLILSGFVCHIWRVIQGRILAFLFPYNPNFLVNEKRFHDQLKLKLSEVKRYGGPCAVMAVTIDRKKDLVNKYGVRGWQQLNEEVVRVFNAYTRETDVFGQIGDGTIIVSLTHTDVAGARKVAQRVGHFIQDRAFVVNRQSLNITISIGVSFYSEQLKSAEDLTMAAIAAVNKAAGNEGDKIVYSDGLNSALVEEPIDGYVDGRVDGKISE